MLSGCLEYFSYMSPCCISSETIVEYFWREEKKVFEKDKNFSHAEIAVRVDHFVNPFMAINLITRNEFRLSKCE